MPYILSKHCNDMPSYTLKKSYNYTVHPFSTSKESEYNHVLSVKVDVYVKLCTDVASNFLVIDLRLNCLQWLATEVSRC